jgi:hypothetical protein
MCPPLPAPKLSWSLVSMAPERAPSLRISAGCWRNAASTTACSTSTGWGGSMPGPTRSGTSEWCWRMWRHSAGPIWQRACDAWVASSIRDRQQLDAVRLAVPAPTRVVRLHVDAALVERRLSSDPSRRTQAARPARGPGVTRGWARRRPGGSAPARRPAGPRDQRSDLLVAGLDLTDPATQAPVVERPLTPERGSGEHAAAQAAEADRDQQEASPSATDRAVGVTWGPLARAAPTERV